MLKTKKIKTRSLEIMSLLGALWAGRELLSGSGRPFRATLRVSKNSVARARAENPSKGASV